MPASPDSAIAWSLTSFAPVYAFGLCDAVHISPPSSSREPTRKYSISLPTSPASTTVAPSATMPSR